MCHEIYLGRGSNLSLNNGADSSAYLRICLGAVVFQIKRNHNSMYNGERVSK